MGNPNDATIDIPLTTVTSKTGARKAEASPSAQMTALTPQGGQSPNEKTGFFHRGPGGRRRAVGVQARSSKDEDGDQTLNKMGQIYNKIRDFSIITRYFLYVLPLAVIIAIPIIIGATVKKEDTIPKNGVRIVWFFSWIEIVWLSLWVSKIVAKWLPSIFMFLCGIVSPGTRKYALVLEALEIPLSLAGWALASLATFKPIMTGNPDQRKQPAGQQNTGWEDTVQNILAAALVASLILVVEKLLIQLISISYHRKQFDLKIKDSKHNIWLLSLLYDASRALFPAYCHEFEEEDYIIQDSIDLSILGSSKTSSGHARSGSATPMRLLQNVGRVGDKVTSAFGNIAHEVTGKQVFNPNSAHSIVVEALEKNKSSEALAKRLWMSFVVEGKDALYEEDIVEVLGPDRHDEAAECFASLDQDGNGDISLDEMILTVCEFGRERKSIASSLHDVDQAINVLDNLLMVAVFVATIFVFVGFLNSSFTTTLATAGTALLSLSFVFASTAQEVLGSCIFLFVKHPFDVGDRVDISTEQLVVERISLLFTVFKKVADHKTTQVPNIVLNSDWIDNITRSKAMREQLLINVSFDTSLEDIQLLRDEIKAFVTDKDNSRDFQPDVDIEVTSVNNMDKMELKVEIKHKSNWSNEAVRAARRSKFMCALVLALRKVPMYAPGAGDAALGSCDKPSYSVAVSDEEAAKSRAAFVEAKDAKRLVPLKKPAPSPNPFEQPESYSTGASSAPTLPPLSNLRNRSPILFTSNQKTEESVVQSLNSRHPASDPAHDWENDTNGNTGERERSSPLLETDRARNDDIEEVRGLLRRTSTRGKRKPPASTPRSANVPIIMEPATPEGAAEMSGGETQYFNYAPPTLSTQQGVAQDPRQNQADISMPGQVTRPETPTNQHIVNQYQQRTPQYQTIPTPYNQSPPRGQQQGRAVPGNNSFAQERDGPRSRTPT